MSSIFVLYQLSEWLIKRYNSSVWLGVFFNLSEKSRHFVALAALLYIYINLTLQFQTNPNIRINNTAILLPFSCLLAMQPKWNPQVNVRGLIRCCPKLKIQWKKPEKETILCILSFLSLSLGAEETFRVYNNFKKKHMWVCKSLHYRSPTQVPCTTIIMTTRWCCCIWRCMHLRVHQCLN